MSEKQANSLQSEEQLDSTELDGFGPIRLVILQATPFCNINCDYCYLPNRQLKVQIPLDLIGPAFEKIFTSRFLGKRFTVCWHAGEPLTLPISFYEAAFEKIQVADHQFNTHKCRVSHFFQTNGTLLNSRWCDLIKKHNVKVGVSLDGPAFIHDAHRKTRQGTGTHASVMRGISVLQANDINLRAIAVLTQHSLDYPDEIFHFFIENGISRVGFNVEEVEGINQSSSLEEEGTETRYRAFMSRFWQLVKESKGALQVREFERICGLIHTDKRIERNQLCTPFSMINIDNQGNFSTFSPELLAMKNNTYGDFILGNILHDSLESAWETDKFQRMYRDIRSGLEGCRNSCEYYGLCGGGAPSNKFWENGSFQSTETRSCRLSKQIVTDIILDDLERSLALNL